MYRQVASDPASTDKKKPPTSAGSEGPYRLRSTLSHFGQDSLPTPVLPTGELDRIDSLAGRLIAAYPSCPAPISRVCDQLIIERDRWTSFFNEVVR
jgi:hypothetical protein